ncbi:MAG TPA: thiamine pyrophosphate-dependent dehydrogenase E1 component subunit alpha [Steroidobacteraceae bacterium]|nr:thiamine pyrophosphate-dependent dehydrogenase E1 component subunit alpha [Steroidobacteraceae bacterium]
MPVGSPRAREWTLEELCGLHRAMVVSRGIERACIEKSGHWYPSLGEEGVIIGTFSQLRPDDAAVPHYRGGLVVPWLRGRSLVQVLGCVTPSQTSPTRGRMYGGFAGGMEFGVMPFITNVLGPNIAVATGMALSFKIRRESRVAVVTFGDGTAGTGEFHESLNMGAALGAPVVYVCQNNGYSISTETQRTLAGKSVADWASRYGMPTALVDGNDVLAVAEAVGNFVARARAGGGPAFIEAKTLRRGGHFGADPGAYMSDEHTRAAEDSDPIRRLEQVLSQRGCEDSRIKSVWATVAGELADAVAKADAQPALTCHDLGLDEIFQHAI